MKGNRGSSGSGSSDGGHGRGGADGAAVAAVIAPRPRTATTRTVPSKKKHRKFDIWKVRCFNCNGTGHFKSDCPEPKRERANLTQVEDVDEPALLMLEACELMSAESTPTEHVYLNEEKVLPKLSGSQDISWHLDTGASNHMTGCAEKFAELGRAVSGKVRFGDGLAVEICGRGSVLMQCLSGEHRVLTDVYFIPRLKSNIISLGQLDENGCKYSSEDGVMTVWDRQRNVLAKVKRTRNRMYVLNIQPAEPVFLLAHAKEEA
jgi:hypothetical protein